jgi:hypothetical protein
MEFCYTSPVNWKDMNPPMQDIPPNGGTWNIRIWRSSSEAGLYLVELQDPSTGVQSSKYRMRFPSQEWAYAWFSSFVTTDQSASELSPGKFLSGKGESTVWLPIIAALHHAAGPKLGEYPASIWWYGSYESIEEIDPLAEIRSDSLADESASENTQRLITIEVVAAHYVKGRTNVFGLQRFFHVDRKIEDFYFRFNGEWVDGLEANDVWQDALEVCRDLVEYDPAEDEDGDGPDPFDLVGISEWAEINPQIIPIFTEMFDNCPDIPWFVAEWATMLPNDGLFYYDLDMDARSLLSSIHDDLSVIAEEFKRHPKSDEFESFISDGNPMQVIDVLELIGFVYKWRIA